MLVALSALHQSRLDWPIETEWLLDDYANLKDGGIAELVKARLGDEGERAEVRARLERALEAALENYNHRFPDHRLFAHKHRDLQGIKLLLEAMAGVRIDGKGRPQ